MSTECVHLSIHLVVLTTRCKFSKFNIFAATPVIVPASSIMCQNVTCAKSDVSFAVIKEKEIGFALRKEVLYTNKVKLSEKNLRKHR